MLAITIGIRTFGPTNDILIPFDDIVLFFRDVFPLLVPAQIQDFIVDRFRLGHEAAIEELRLKDEQVLDVP